MRNTPDFSLADQVVGRALEAGAFTSACLLVGRGERVLYRRAYGRLSIDDDAPPPTSIRAMTWRPSQAAGGGHAQPQGHGGRAAVPVGQAGHVPGTRRRISGTSPLPRS